MSADQVLITDVQDGVMTITLNRQKANAFNTELVGATHAAFKEAARSSEVRCVLLTGSGRFFSAGQDLSEFQSPDRGSVREHLQRTYNPLIVQIRQVEKPVIAAINGVVVGAALGIALACDLRIAAENAQFLVGFLGIGLAPDSAVSLLLPELIGLGRATDLAYSNRPLTAGEALEWGLVNRVVPADELLSQAAAWAAELAKGPVGAMGLTKRAFNNAVLRDLNQVLDYEAHIQEIAGEGDEHHEGVQAFVEKRTPIFT